MYTHRITSSPPVCVRIHPRLVNFPRLEYIFVAQTRRWGEFSATGGDGGKPERCFAGGAERRTRTIHRSPATQDESYAWNIGGGAACRIHDNITALRVHARIPGAVSRTRASDSPLSRNTRRIKRRITRRFVRRMNCCTTYIPRGGTAGRTSSWPCSRSPRAPSSPTTARPRTPDQKKTKKGYSSTVVVFVVVGGSGVLVVVSHEHAVVASHDTYGYPGD